MQGPTTSSIPGIGALRPVVICPKMTSEVAENLARTNAQADLTMEAKVMPVFLLSGATTVRFKDLLIELR
tara:strand:+ start:270 stop:479 length:210 start_codon:yes stop_codon:yes gene_type:complete